MSYDFINGAVHRETQEPDGEGEAGFDLTVAEVYEVADAGRVDFGGGEIEDAELSRVSTEKRSPEDDYGWWNLDAGTYVVEYNESVEADRVVEVMPRSEVLRRGAYHPTVHVSELRPLPLTVGGDGLCLKENARISVLCP